MGLVLLGNQQQKRNGMGARGWEGWGYRVTSHLAKGRH